MLAEARSRYTAFLADRSRVSPDDQGVLLAVVAHHADAATFDQLYALAKVAADPAEMLRYFMALCVGEDDQLAARVAAIAVSDEMPPQAASLRLGLLATLAGYHARLSWDTFSANSARRCRPWEGMPTWCWRRTCRRSTEPGCRSTSSAAGFARRCRPTSGRWSIAA